MEATKSALNVTVEILKFTFTCIIAISSAIAYLLLNKETLTNADEYLTYCYFIVGIILIALIVIIFAILALLSKLKGLDK